MTDTHPIQPSRFGKHDAIAASVLLLGTLFLFVVGIGSYPLWDPWEPKYAEAINEMVERGDMVTPYFNDKIRWTKPILIYWAMAAPMALFGNTEFTARLPSALAAMGGVLLLFYCMRLLRGRRTAFIAAGVLATLPQYFYLARQAMPDMLLTCCLTGTLGFFALGRFYPERRRLHWMLFYASLALAVLTKGPVGLALTLGALGLFWLPQIDGRRLLAPSTWVADLKAFLADHEVWRGAVLFTVIALPWYAIMYFKYGTGLVDKFILDENIDRFASPIREHHGTAEYYIQDVLHAMYPWMSFLPMSLVYLFHRSTGFDARARQRWLYVSWCLAAFLIFSIAGTKIDHYILPLTPGLAVLVALAWEAYLEDDAPFWVAPAFLVSILFAIMPVRDFLVEGDRYIFKVFTNARDIDHAGLETAFLIFLAAWIAVILFAVARRRSFAAAALALLVAYGHALYMTHVVLPEHSPSRTMKYYVERYTSLEQPGSELVFFGKIRYSMYYYFGKERFRAFESDEAAELAAYVGDRPDIFIIAESSRIGRLTGALRQTSRRRWYPVASEHPRYVLIANDPRASAPGG